MNTKIIYIKGMHCKSCEILVENNLKKISGVKEIKINYKTGRAEISFAGPTPNHDDILQAVKNAGYDLGGETEKLILLSNDQQDYKNLAIAGLIILVGYIIAKWFGLFDLNINTSADGMAISLLVGLVAGISTCMALIGGLVLALAARHAEIHPEATAMQKFRPHLFFNLGRIVGFSVLGGLIGLLGSTVKFSSNILGIMTIVIGFMMIFLGLKLVEIFPFLKDKSISLPKSIAKFFGFKSEQKEYSHKGAVVTGALTFFLPCGFTQAMQLYAVSVGSFWRGALIMFLFALGTAPGLLGIGGISSLFKGERKRLFFATAGVLVILFGIYNVTNASRIISIGGNNTNNTLPNGKTQEIQMTQKSNGYTPNVFTVKKGIPVKWIITSETIFSCASYIVMPKYNISQSLKKGENIITFTPTETGEIPFSCSMGMYTGKFIVVESDAAVSAPTTNKSLSTSGGGCKMMSGGGCGGCGGMARNNY